MVTQEHYTWPVFHIRRERVVKTLTETQKLREFTTSNFFYKKLNFFNIYLLYNTLQIALSSILGDVNTEEPLRTTESPPEAIA